MCFLKKKYSDNKEDKEWRPSGWKEKNINLKLDVVDS
jgi:hypothetical protein